MDLLLIFLWIFITFCVGSLSGLIGKKYGVEYPISLFAVLIILGNIFANKIVMFGPFNVPAGIIVFSMTFFISDLLSEKWGKKFAQKAVWAGFFAEILLIISLYVVIVWKPAPFAVEFSEMFKKVLVLTPRITLAGFIAYLVSQNHDVWAFDFWKKLTKGKHLWLRNNASTILSQLIDSVIFITLAFYGIFPIWNLIFGVWIVKIIIALIDTPFMYVTIWIMDKIK